MLVTIGAWQNPMPCCRLISRLQFHEHAHLIKRNQEGKEYNNRPNRFILCLDAFESNSWCGERGGGRVGGFSFTPWRHNIEQNKVWTSTNSLFGSNTLLSFADVGWHLTLISKSKERGEVYFLLQLQTLRWMIEGQWSQWVRVHWYFHSPEAL